MERSGCSVSSAALHSSSVCSSLWKQKDSACNKSKTNSTDVRNTFESYYVVQSVCSNKLIFNWQRLLDVGQML